MLDQVKLEAQKLLMRQLYWFKHENIEEQEKNAYDRDLERYIWILQLIRPK